MHRECNMNCAQSVLCAFHELTELDEPTLAAIAEGFGSGMRSGEVCGAVSGAVMAIGLMEKAKYAGGLRNETVKKNTVEFMRAFKNAEGYLRCHDLLAASKEKQCDKYIADAVKILEKIIEGEQK